MKTMKFGIIGLRPDGAEFASATLRWVHLKDEITKAGDHRRLRHESRVLRVV